jgi:UPF0755 protein
MAQASDPVAGSWPELPPLPGTETAADLRQAQYYAVAVPGQSPSASLLRHPFPHLPTLPAAPGDASAAPQHQFGNASPAVVPDAQQWHPHQAQRLQPPPPPYATNEGTAAPQYQFVNASPSVVPDQQQWHPHQAQHLQPPPPPYAAATAAPAGAHPLAAAPAAMPPHDGEVSAAFAEHEDDPVSAATRARRDRPQLPPLMEEPRRKLRHRRTIRLMQMLMSLLFFLAVASAAFFMYSRYQIDRPGPLTRPAEFEVERGQGLSQIADNLERQGIIRDRKLFAVNVAARKMAKRLRAGRYSIPERASMQKVLEILIAGRALFNQITVVEGTTSEQTVELLCAQPMLVGDITEIPPEGSLMPDTYQIAEGLNRNDLLAQMQKAQADYLAEKWQERQSDLPFKTPQEAVTLASIVEKETGVPEERGKVAGVFINRLRKGMKLQSDPTIIYGLVGGKGKLGHPLLRSELMKKTDYNTYQIVGLPPTPIANPGRQAIEAVLKPETTDHLYFVADGSGGHAFAANLKDHQTNVAKWRQIEAARREEEKREAEEAARQAEAAAQSSPAEPAKPVAGVSVEPAEPQQGKDGAKLPTDGDAAPDASKPSAAAPQLPTATAVVQPQALPVSVAQQPVPAAATVAPSAPAAAPAVLPAKETVAVAVSASKWDADIPLPSRNPKR